jgi:alkyldihydroxyacetonephosphate synthase
VGSATSLSRFVESLGTTRWTVDEADLTRYSHDSWPLQTKLAAIGDHEYCPDIVVFPSSTQEVARLLEAATKNAMPVTARGLGSSVTGQPLPQYRGAVFDLTDLIEPIEVDEFNCTVTLGAGWAGGDLEDTLREIGFTTGHSPQSLYRSTVGGWVATMASGQLSSRYGGIEQLLVSAEVVLSDGTIAQVGLNPRGAMGPDLKYLFIGSEGVFGIVTKVTLRIHRTPEFTEREAFRLPSSTAALTAIRSIAQSGTDASLVRLYDPAEARHVLQDSEFDDWLLCLAVEGAREPTQAAHKFLRSLVIEQDGLSMGSEPVERWITTRYDFSRIENILATPGGYAETIEVAHTWSRIGDLYETLTAALAELAENVFGHFSHIYGQGASLYVIVSGQAETDDEAIARLKSIWSTAMLTCLSEGAVLSHHHGAGLARAPYVAQAMGSAAEILSRVKAALDPQGILNPGKLGLGGR